MRIPSLLSAILFLGFAGAAPLLAADPIQHRFLCSDYSGGKVCIVGADGKIEWEFPAKTPQDCWMLPNGNVLFSHRSGAKEVTLQKEVVWEYKGPEGILRDRILRDRLSVGSFKGHSFKGQVICWNYNFKGQVICWQF